MTNLGRKQNMHVIWHHAPSLQTIACAVAEKQSVDDRRGAARIAEHRAAVMPVKHVIAIARTARDSIKQSENDVLTDAVAIEMRKIATAVPSLPAHGSIS
jgi:hypothetical protein